MIADVDKFDFVGMRNQQCHNFLKRNVRVLVGIAISIFMHAALLWFTIEHESEVKQLPRIGNAGHLSVSLVPHPQEAIPIVEAPVVPSRVFREKTRQEKKTAARTAQPPTQKMDAIASRPEVREEKKTIAQTDSSDMSAQLEAKRLRREQERSSKPVHDEELAQKNNAVRENMAASLGKVTGTDNSSKGAIEVRHYDRDSGAMVLKLWDQHAGKFVTQYVEVSRNDELDIQTAMVKKMLELIRNNYRRDSVFMLNRIGRKIIIFYQTDYDADLRKVLIREYFPDFVPVPR